MLRSGAGRYRTCHGGRSNLGIARGTRSAGGRGTEGSEVLPLVELHGGRGTRLIAIRRCSDQDSFADGPPSEGGLATL